MPAEKMSDSKNKSKRPRLSSEESYSSSSSSSLSSSSDEETDAKDLKPIKEYLPNRKELASQLFKSVKIEKIRMMLPQILKKVDLNELEELCANELIGMSKKRIMCVINDQPMVESSDTEDSDDSGPSLEIISDTEWLSEEGGSIKLEGAKSKSNKDVKKLKKKSQVQKNPDIKNKLKLKTKVKSTDSKINSKVKTEKIKIEGKPKEKEKEKEGESLLDLLELEMRARAIRALIRKEEDSSSQKNAKSKNSVTETGESGPSNDQSSKARQASLKEQLEKIDVLMKHGEDEDVFVVIQPAPTIDLLSSESENEDHSKRVNQKLVNERKSESENVQENLQSAKTIENGNEEKIVNHEKSSSGTENITKEKSKDVNNKLSTDNVSKDKSKNLNNKKMESQIENLNLPMSVTESNVDKPENTSNPPEDLEEGEIVDDSDEIVKEQVKEHSNNVVLEKKIKKIKKNPNVRYRKKDRINSDEESADKDKGNQPIESKNDKSSNGKSTPQKIEEDPIIIEESPKRESDSEKVLNLNINDVDQNSKEDIFDDKSLDIEEIINLDDYPDDMDEIEKGESNNDTIKNKTTDSKINETNNASSSSATPSSETWTTRYYKQDDVKNVIKESKIQSEIRKRLRERQRQIKMNNSPVLKHPETSQSSPELPIPKPTGSVEEYLALKGLTNENKSVSENTENNNSGNSTDASKDASGVNVDDSTVATEKKFEDENKNADNSISVPKKNLVDQNINVDKQNESSVTNLCIQNINKTENKEASLLNSNIEQKSDVEGKEIIETEKNLVINEKDDLINEKCRESSLNIDENKISDLKQSTPKKNKENSDVTSVVNETLNVSVNIESTKRISTPLRDDVNSSKSDSSDDNIIVKIDSDVIASAKSLEMSNPENIQNVPRNQDTSETRADT